MKKQRLFDGPEDVYVFFITLVILSQVGLMIYDGVTK